jgi:protein-S-isoprenylcysteine O-methyltransferase Ste14
MPVRVVGGVFVAGGAAVLIHAFTRFVVEGLGTPAPVAPPQQLVTGGLYRHVRNPMYLAVGAAIVGQAALLGQPVLLLYVAGVTVVVVAFVRYYEEPTLARTFGAEYEEYRRNVPAWWPRRRPWRASMIAG